MGKKQKFEIHLKGTGAFKKPDKLKVEFFLNHIGDSWLEIYSNYLPEHDDRGRGEAKLLARNPDNYATVLAKFEAYFKRGDVKPMLREKFRLRLRREAAETFDSWVVIVKEGPPNSSFLSIFKRALRNKLTFFCKEDSYKLKLYDQGAAVSLENSVKILLLRGAAKRELQESKTAEFESVTQRGPK